MTRPLAILTLIAAVSLPSAWGDQARGASDGRTGTAPVYYAKDVREKYVALGDSGTSLLRAGKIDEALALFAQMETVIPDGPWARFNRACAYGQAGKTSEAIDELDRACDAGFDNVAALQDAAGLAPVLRESRGEKIVRRAQKNSDKHLAFLSHGLPAAAPLPVPSDSIDAYMSRESRRLYEQYNVWYPWQMRSATLELRSRQLESMRLARKDDPQFDYGLSRVRLMANVVSIVERWGVVADGVTQEVEKYLATNPPPAGRAEATYYRGVAAFCRERPLPASPEWKDAAGDARRIFAQVDTTTAPAGAAAAWLLALDLWEAGEAKQAVYPKVLEFSTRWANSQPAQTIANALFKIEFIKARWPVPFDVVDLEGKPVTLEQYRGKLLLIDFWATWCGPCRNELPALKDAYAKYHDRGLEILSISLDYPQKTTLDMYRDWISENGMTWRHVYDLKNFTSPLAQGFNVRSIPAPFLIGRDGVPVAMLDDLRGPNLARAIEKAL